MSNVKTLWLVGEVLPEGHECGHSWQFIGIFDSQSKAIAACKTENYFTGSAILNEAIECEPKPWPVAFFPLRNDE